MNQKDQDEPSAVIDSSLARGASRSALRELADRSAEAARPSRQVLFGSRRARRTQFLLGLEAAMAPVALHHQFTNQLGFGGAVSSVLFSAQDDSKASIQLGNALGARNGPSPIHIISGLVVELNQHALQRLNQRLHLLDLNGVRDALRPAAMLLIILSYTLMLQKPQPKQIVVPFCDGALRCDVTDGHASVVVRTFVPQPSAREKGIVNDVSEAYSQLDQTRVAALMWLPWAVQLVARGNHHRLAKQAMHALTDFNLLMVDALRKHPWLFEPYLGRDDPIGQNWSNAAGQNQ